MVASTGFSLFLILFSLLMVSYTRLDHRSLCHVVTDLVVHSSVLSYYYVFAHFHFDALLDEELLLVYVTVLFL